MAKKKQRLHAAACARAIGFTRQRMHQLVAMHAVKPERDGLFDLARVRAQLEAYRLRRPKKTLDSALAAATAALKRFAAEPSAPLVPLRAAVHTVLGPGVNPYQRARLWLNSGKVPTATRPDGIHWHVTTQALRTYAERMRRTK